MSGVSKIVIVVLAWSLASCEMSPLGRAKTPPTPAPEAAKTEPPPAPSVPSEPLSIPQTQVQLPRPQPIDPEALATPPVTVAAEPASQRPPHRTARRTGPNPAPTAAKPEPVETAE